MAMSCVAEETVNPISSIQRSRSGREASRSGTRNMAAAMAKQQIVTQVRRSPKRSSSGDQKTLIVHGRVIAPIMPISVSDTLFWRK